MNPPRCRPGVLSRPVELSRAQASEDCGSDTLENRRFLGRRADLAIFANPPFPLGA